MAVIIESKQDNGSWVPATELAERVRGIDPDATIRLVKGSVSGIEVTDGAAVRYLMTRYTAKGNARKGSDSNG